MSPSLSPGWDKAIMCAAYRRSSYLFFTLFASGALLSVDFKYQQRLQLNDLRSDKKNL
jgi:hypothetical protein